MIKKGLLTLLVIFINFANANFQEGKKVFEQRCASCHKEYISFKKLKENFYQRNNTLLNLTIPTENMLAWAIVDGNKKIGDPKDPEMRAIEIEEYLKEYLANPDINNSICDKKALKYYIKKEPMKISDEEAELLSQYFLGYKKERLKNIPKITKVLNDRYDDKQIIDKATSLGKHIIVYATSQSCYFCKKMQREVLSQIDVQEAINDDYIFLKVDVDFTKLPLNLKNKFKGMTPTFFILTPNAELLNVYPGAWIKEDFLEILKENL